MLNFVWSLCTMELAPVIIICPNIFDRFSLLKLINFSYCHILTDMSVLKINWMYFYIEDWHLKARRLTQIHVLLHVQIYLSSPFIHTIVFFFFFHSFFLPSFISFFKKDLSLFLYPSLSHSFILTPIHVVYTF